MGDMGPRGVNDISPIDIREFRDGVAEVSWQVSSDGRYYMDGSGFGMSGDVEETLHFH